MATPFLRISNGSSNIDFLNGSTATSYLIESGDFAPRVTTRRGNPFGGVTPYNNVTEDIEFTIMGSSSADCYQKLDELNVMLDQADQYYAGDQVTAVKLQFSPGNSTVSSDSAPLESLILGRAGSGEEDTTVLQPTWDAASFAFVLPVRIRFVRRGLWAHSTESASSASTTAPGVFSITMPSTRTILSPTKLEIAGGVYQNIWPESIIAWSDRSAGVQIVNAKDYGATSGTPPISTVNESANLATGSNVVRWQAQNVAAFANYTQHSVISGLGFNYVEVFAAVRNNSSSVDFTAYCQTIVTGRTVSDTRGCYIPYGSTTPRVVRIGILPLQGEAITNVNISVIATTTSAAHTLDIDALMFVFKYDEWATGSIKLRRSDASLSTALNIDPRILTAINPSVYTTFSTANYYHTYDGRPEPYTTGSALRVGFLACDGVYWNARNAAGTGKYSGTVTATRHKAYLTPR
jgi:hypothetical protein